MAYIPNTYAPPFSSGKKSVRISLPQGGVSLSDRQETVSDGKCAYISNLDIISGTAVTREAQKELLECSGFSGQLYSVTKQPFCDRAVMHIGSCLYSYYPGDEEMTLISDNLPDSKSVFCEFMSKLYIYSDTRIFSLDNSFTLCEEEPEPVLMFDDISIFDGTDAKITNNVHNIMSCRITVNFHSNVVDKIRFPRLCDTTRKIEAYIDGTAVDLSMCTVTEEMIIFPENSSSVTYSVTYYVKNPEDIGFDGSIYDCKCVCAYGGDSTGGTRIFFTGNENKKGYYYKSKLQNPLYAGSDEYEIIGDGCENVTSLIKMYGDLMVFTECSVFRMGYSLTQDGAFFSVKELNSGIGCDCPSSVQLIDNRVVFANSKKGVFIVDASEETGEQNIKPISGNILRGRGKGILDNDRSLITQAQSIDYDRKYMLFIGNKVYIWDYDKSGFSDSGNYSKAQERLSWYIYEGINCGSVFESECGIVILDTDKMCFYGFDGDKKAREGVSYLLDSGSIEISDSERSVFVTDVLLHISRQSGTFPVMTFFADAEEYSRHVVSVPLSGRTLAVRIRLPKKKLRRFAFKISGSGCIELEDIIVKYIPLSK